MVEDPEKRFIFTIARSADHSGGPRPIAVEVRDLDRAQVEHLRGLLAGRLGPGYEAAIDGAVVARGPDDAARALSPSPATVALAVEEQARRLTEMAVQQHEYCYAELQRMRRDYEEEFAQERAVLRTLRQRWMEWICDDKIRIDDVLRFLGDTVTSALKDKDADKQADPPRG